LIPTRKILHSFPHAPTCMNLSTEGPALTKAPATAALSFPGSTKTNSLLWKEEKKPTHYSSGCVHKKHHPDHTPKTASLLQMYTLQTYRSGIYSQQTAIQTTPRECINTRRSKNTQAGCTTHSVYLSPSQKINGRRHSKQLFKQRVTLC